MKHCIQTQNVIVFVLLGLAARVTAQDTPDISLIFYLDEKSENGTLVGTITANDPDMDNPTFSIVSGNDAGAFSIHTTSGDLTVADEDQLNFDVNPSFALVVEANDGNGGITTVSITINLNDLPLGLGDASKDIELYPNPVADVLVIELKDVTLRTSYFSLHTIGGKPAPVDFAFTANSRIEIDCRRLRSGLYILRMTSDTNQEVNRRVLIQR